MPSAIQARACLRDLCHAAMHTIIIPPRRDPEARRNLSRREQCANCRPAADFSLLGVNLLTEPRRDRDGPPSYAPGRAEGGRVLQVAEKLMFCMRARLYRLRKNSLNEGHGFSGAAEYATGEGPEIRFSSDSRRMFL